MLFCCLWRNVETSCHKHFVVLSRHQQPPPLTTSEVSQHTDRWFDRVVLTQHLAGSSVNSTHWSQILAQHRDFCLPHLHSTPSLGGWFPSEYCYAVWYGKTRMVWLPDGEKLRECTNVTDTRTDGQTDRQTDRGTDTAWRHRPRLHSIARQKCRLHRPHERGLACQERS